VLAGRESHGRRADGDRKDRGFALPILQRLALSQQLGIGARHARCARWFSTHTRATCPSRLPRLCRSTQKPPLRSTVVYGGVRIAHDSDGKRLRKGWRYSWRAGRLLDHVQEQDRHAHQYRCWCWHEGDRMLEHGIPARHQAQSSPCCRRSARTCFLGHLPDEIPHPRQDSAAQSGRTPDRGPAMRRPSSSLTCCIRVAREKNASCSPTSSRPRTASGPGIHRHPQSVRIAWPTSCGATISMPTPSMATIAAERLVALEGFKSGKTNVLVATDVASRGLDIEGLPQWINFDMAAFAGGLHPPHRPHRPRRADRPRLFHWLHPRMLESIAAIERLDRRNGSNGCWFPDSSQRRHRCHADGRATVPAPRRDAKKHGGNLEQYARSTRFSPNPTSRAYRPPSRRRRSQKPEPTARQTQAAPARGASGGLKRA